MVKPYITEDMKFKKYHFPAWSWELGMDMQEMIQEKGYKCTAVSRVGSDLKVHDAWRLDRDEYPVILEGLFRERISVEVQVEESYRVTLIFVYDDSPETLMDVIRKLPVNKNKRDYIDDYKV